MSLQKFFLRLKKQKTPLIFERGFSASGSYLQHFFFFFATVFFFFVATFFFFLTGIMSPSF